LQQHKIKKILVDMFIKLMTTITTMVIIITVMHMTITIMIMIMATNLLPSSIPDRQTSNLLQRKPTANQQLLPSSHLTATITATMATITATMTTITATMATITATMATSIHMGTDTLTNILTGTLTAMDMLIQNLKASLFPAKRRTLGCTPWVPRWLSVWRRS
jgi:hypothetical protein